MSEDVVKKKWYDIAMDHPFADKSFSGLTIAETETFNGEYVVFRFTNGMAFTLCSNGKGRWLADGPVFE